MAEEMNRRDFLSRLPDLLRRSAASLAETLSETFPESRAFSPPALNLASRGALLDGFPVRHDWIVVAHAAAEQLARRLPYGLLLGASGEAFRIAWDRENPAGAATRCHVNTFLAALGLAGLAPRDAAEGPFEPALGEVEAALDRGRIVVVAGPEGPGILVRVDRKREEVEWATPRPEPARISFEAFDRLWSRARWLAGEAPYLRVTVKAAKTGPRPLTEIARLGLGTMERLLRPGEGAPPGSGLAAWKLWAEDLRSGAIPLRSEEAMCATVLPLLAAGRAAAGRYLEGIARAIPPDRREAMEAAARCYLEIHDADATGEVPGAGLLEEFMDCVMTDGLLDLEKREDPALREHAAALLEEIHDLEAKALDLLVPLS